MNILFLDLSSKSTGWCLSTADGTMLKWGCITASSTNTLSRIAKMVKEINTIIAENDVGKLVAEDVHPEAYGQKSHTERMLMWLQGGVALTAHDVNDKFDYPNIDFMNSSEWRKMLGIKTGRGVRREVLKEADIQFVKNTYNISANDDICDAICLYTAYFNKKK